MRQGLHNDALAEAPYPDAFTLVEEFLPTRYAGP